MCLFLSACPRSELSAFFWVFLPILADDGCFQLLAFHPSVISIVVSVISVMVSVISIISACHFCHVCHFCLFCLSFLSCLSYLPWFLPFLPIIFILSFVSAIVSVISTCPSPVVCCFCLWHPLLPLCPPVFSVYPLTLESVCHPPFPLGGREWGGQTQLLR